MICLDSRVAQCTSILYLNALALTYGETINKHSVSALRRLLETRKRQKFQQTTQSFLTSILLRDYVRSLGAISGPENSLLYPAVTPTPRGRSKELRRWYCCCFFLFRFFSGKILCSRHPVSLLCVPLVWQLGCPIQRSLAVLQAGRSTKGVAVLCCCVELLEMQIVGMTRADVTNEMIQGLEKLLSHSNETDCI